MIRNVYRSSCKVPLFLSDCNETWIFLDSFFRKIPQNIKFRKNPFWGSRVVPCGRTNGPERHDEANSHISQFLRTRLKTGSLRTNCLKCRSVGDICKESVNCQVSTVKCQLSSVPTISVVKPTRCTIFSSLLNITLHC